jgi:hypothetical protein
VAKKLLKLQPLLLHQLLKPLLLHQLLKPLLLHQLLKLLLLHLLLKPHQLPSKLKLSGNKKADASRLFYCLNPES